MINIDYMIKKLSSSIIIFLIVFIAVSLIIDIYYFDRVVSKDPNDKGQISYSDFRVFWVAAYNIYHHIIKFWDRPKGYPTFRQFWFLNPKLRDPLTSLSPGNIYEVYKKDVEFYHFRYSPFIAFIMIPLGRITPPANALIVWYVLLNIIFLSALLLIINQLNKDFGLTTEHRYIVLWTTFLISLQFYFMNISLGQTDIIVSFLFVLFLIAYIRNKDVLCGISLALIFQLKPFFLPILFYFLLTWRVKIIISTFIALLCFLFMPAYMLGFGKTMMLLRDWIDILSMSVSSQILNTKNQSLVYAISNLILKIDSIKNLFISPQYLFYFISAMLTLCAYIILVCSKKIEGKQDEKKHKYLEVSMFIIISLLFSVIVWESYFITLIIPVGITIYLILLGNKKIVSYVGLGIFFILSCVIGTDLTKYIIVLKDLHFTNISIGTIFLAFTLIYSYRACLYNKK